MNRCVTNKVLSIFRPINFILLFKPIALVTVTLTKHRNDTWLIYTIFRERTNLNRRDIAGRLRSVRLTKSHLHRNNEKIVSVLETMHCIKHACIFLRERERERVKMHHECQCRNSDWKVRFSYPTWTNIMTFFQFVLEFSIIYPLWLCEIWSHQSIYWVHKQA